MKTYSICQNCVWTHHPATMLTGYCMDGSCDLCGHFSRLAMVKRECYCEDIRRIYPKADCDFCTGLRKEVAQT